MLDENFKKPTLHLALDKIGSSQVCFVRLNIDLGEKNIGAEDDESKKTDQQLHVIFSSINASVENKITELNETISAYECDRFMSMTIPVIFLTPIPSYLSDNVDKHLKSKGYVCGNRVVVKFERTQPEFRVKAEDRPNTLSHDSVFFKNKKSIDVLPTIQECVEPESKPKINHADVKLELEKSFRDSGKGKASKNFGLPKFGIFKKHNDGYKKIESLPKIPQIPRCQ